MTKATIILNLIDSYNSEFQYGQNINYVDLKSLMQTAYDLAERTNYTRSEVLEIIGRVLIKAAIELPDTIDTAYAIKYKMKIQNYIRSIDREQFLKK